MPKIKEIKRVSDSNGMQFLLDGLLTRAEPYSYKKREDAEGIEWVLSLLAMEHVTEIRVRESSVSVYQDGETVWSQLLIQIAPFIREARPVEGSPFEHPSPQESSQKASVDRRAIARELRKVIDPELGINIVDLGLVYNILQDEGKVTVEFTATTPGCPMRRYLEQHIEGALEATEGVEAYEAKLVWQPPWSVDMMDPEVSLFS